MLLVAQNFNVPFAAFINFYYVIEFVLGGGEFYGLGVFALSIIIAGVSLSNVVSK